MIVTPQQAAEWLLGSRQTELKLRKARDYARAMAAGKWRADDDRDPIMIRAGTMVGGNHRCAAILMVGQPVETAVKVLA